MGEMYRKHVVVILPSQYFYGPRDHKCSEKAPNGKYGDCDGPKERDRLRSDRFVVSLHPCLIVKSFNVLQQREHMKEINLQNFYWRIFLNYKNISQHTALNKISQKVDIQLDYVPLAICQKSIWLCLSVYITGIDSSTKIRCGK